MWVLAATETWTAASKLRLRWDRGYRAQSRRGRERGDVGAHSGAVGMVSRLGGAPEWPNRRRRSSAAGEGKTSGVAFRGSSGRVTRRGGRGRTGGASWGVGEARGGRWPWVRRRWRRAPLGGVRERKTEEGMGSRGREGRCRGRGRLRGVARESGRLPRRSRRWPALFGRAPRLASAYWQMKTTSGEGVCGGGLGHQLDQRCGGAKLGRFVAPGKLGFSLLFCFFI